MDKPTVFSGIQATGMLTLGNYIGAIGNWLKMQDDYNCIYSIVDLHSLTVRQNPAEFRQRSTSFFAQYLASGLDPKKSIIFYQSHVAEHAELQWILDCFCYIGELQRMTQFKDKSAKNEDNLNVGLLNYPVLMAADILLYQTGVVPIGIDQKQHVELTRDIAMRFNNIYGDVFTIPEPYFGKQGAKIYSLQNPLAKMSKSDTDINASVSIIDTPDDIMRKFKRAVTDSDTVVEYRPDKPGINNLLTIFSCIGGKSIDELVTEYHDSGYKRFKNDVGEAVVEKLRPLREEYLRLLGDKAYLAEIAKEGADKARYLAQKTLRKVKKKIGLVER